MLNLKLFLELFYKRVYLALEMLLETIHTNFFDIFSVEPFYDSVFHFAHATQISEVLLMLVSVWRKVMNSIIVTNFVLVWQWQKLNLIPDHFI